MSGEEANGACVKASDQPDRSRYPFTDDNDEHHGNDDDDDGDKNKIKNEYEQ